MRRKQVVAIFLSALMTFAGAAPAVYAESADNLFESADVQTEVVGETEAVTSVESSQGTQEVTETPVEEAPVQEAAVEEVPAQAAPSEEEAATEETVTEETLVEEFVSSVQTEEVKEEAATAIPAMEGSLKIHGTPGIDAVLYGDFSEVQPADLNPAALTYEWISISASESGETVEEILSSKPVYQVKEEDLGKMIRLTVKADGTEYSGSLSASAEVKKDAPQATLTEIQTGVTSAVAIYGLENIPTIISVYGTEVDLSQENLGDLTEEDFNTDTEEASESDGDTETEEDAAQSDTASKDDAEESDADKASEDDAEGSEADKASKDDAEESEKDTASKDDAQEADTSDTAQEEESTDEIIPESDPVSEQSGAIDDATLEAGMEALGSEVTLDEDTIDAAEAAEEIDMESDPVADEGTELDPANEVVTDDTDINALDSMTLVGSDPLAAEYIASYGAEKTAEAFGLPSTVGITVEDSNGMQIADVATIVWDVESCDYEQNFNGDQSFQVVGTLILPDGVNASSDLDLQVYANVTVNGPSDAASTAATAVSADGNMITGMTEGQNFTKGSTVTFTAEGAGMSNTLPTEGDTRYLPSTWSIVDNTGAPLTSGEYDGVNYTKSLTANLEGSYTVSVQFVLQTYTAGTWTSDSQTTDTKSVNFTVGAANTAVTPTPSSTAPADVKTGDTTNIIPIIIVLVIALAAIAGVLVYKNKKK